MATIKTVNWYHYELKVFHYLIVAAHHRFSCLVYPRTLNLIENKFHTFVTNFQNYMERLDRNSEFGDKKRLTKHLTEFNELVADLETKYQVPRHQITTENEKSAVYNETKEKLLATYASCMDFILDQIKVKVNEYECEEIQKARKRLTGREQEKIKKYKEKEDEILEKRRKEVRNEELTAYINTTEGLINALKGVLDSYSKGGPYLYTYAKELLEELLERYQRLVLVYHWKKFDKPV